MEEPLFVDGWTGGDEIKLLLAIEELGYGNWLVVCHDQIIPLRRGQFAAINLAKCCIILLNSNLQSISTHMDRFTLL